MLIKYVFQNGQKSEVEVEENLGLVISAMEREDENYERKTRRWCPVKLDSAEYEGKWFEDNNTPELQYELSEQEKRVAEFKKTLTPTQLRRLEIRENDPSISFQEISRIEGTNVRAIWESFEQIKKKHKKFFG